jgi:hypothetical protein
LQKFEARLRDNRTNQRHYGSTVDQIDSINNDNGQSNSPRKNKDQMKQLAMTKFQDVHKYNMRSKTTMKYDGETESKHETHGAAKVGYQFTYY